MPVAQFSGLSSGIDSAALIDAIIQAREAQNEIRRSEIEHLESENSALEEFNTKVLALNDLIERFRTVNAGGVGKKGNSSAPTIATASANSSAANATYSLNVSSIAKAATTSFDNSYGSATDVVSASSGNLAITIGEGPDLITINAAVVGGVTTLDELANAINTDPAAAGRVTASVVNISTGSDYRLVLSSQQTGTGRGKIEIAADAGLTELQAVTTEQATDAIFTLGGISGNIIRPDNNISNVINGVTFSLQGTGSAEITIANDVGSTSDQMQEIIDSYNDLVQFVNENDIVTRVESGRTPTNVFGSLAKTRVDDDFMSAFRQTLLGAEATNGTTVRSLSELGLSTNRDGTISFDADRFKRNAEADPTGATQVLNSFADSISGVDGVINQYTRFQGFIDIAQQGNNDEIERISGSIQALERQSEKIRESLQRQFSGLEAITARMQSQQQALTGILAGLG